MSIDLLYSVPPHSNCTFIRIAEGEYRSDKVLFVPDRSVGDNHTVFEECLHRYRRLNLSYIQQRTDYSALGLADFEGGYVKLYPSVSCDHPSSFKIKMPVSFFTMAVPFIQSEEPLSLRSEYGTLQDDRGRWFFHSNSNEEAFEQDLGGIIEDVRGKGVVCLYRDDWFHFLSNGIISCSMRLAMDLVHMRSIFE